MVPDDPSVALCSADDSQRWSLTHRRSILYRCCLGSRSSTPDQGMGGMVNREFYIPSVVFSPGISAFGLLDRHPVYVYCIRICMKD